MSIHALRDKILGQAGELTREDLADLGRLDRMHQVLVKLGSGRFVTSAQDAPGLIACIEWSQQTEDMVPDLYQDCPVRNMYVRGIWLLSTDPWHQPPLHRDRCLNMGTYDESIELRMTKGDLFEGLPRPIVGTYTPADGLSQDD